MLGILVLPIFASIQSEPDWLKTAVLIQSGSQKQLILANGNGISRLNYGDSEPVGWSSDGEHLALLDANGGLSVATPPALPKPLASNVESAKWSPNGQTLLISQRNQGISRVDFDDEPKVQKISPVGREPVWSPDGERVAFAGEGKLGGLWVAKASGENPRRMVKGIGIKLLSWSPDGLSLAFIAETEKSKGLQNLFVTRLGSRSYEKLGAVDSFLVSWDPGSRYLLAKRKDSLTYYTMATQSWSTLGNGFKGTPQWCGPQRFLMRRADGIAQVFLGSAPKFSPLPLPKGTEGEVLGFAQVPGIFAVSNSAETRMNKLLPKPENGEVKVQGWLDEIDPFEGIMTVRIRTLTDSKGVEVNFSKPAIQTVQLGGKSMFRNTVAARRMRVVDVRQDGEVAMILSGPSLTGTTPMEIRTAVSADVEVNPSFIPAGRDNRPTRAIEYDGVCMDFVEVPLVFPVAGKVNFSDSFLASRGGGSRRHHGQDLMAAKMTPLVATFDGTVYFGRGGRNAGNSITLRGDCGWTASYMHLNNDTPGTDDGKGSDRYAFAPGLQNGDRVIAGQFLGWVGDSGNAESTGPHCHFELSDDIGGGIVNAFPSLQSAIRIAEPKTVAADDDLKPRKGQIRWDGQVVAIDKTKRAMQVALVAKTDKFGKRKTVTNALRVWLVLSPKAEIVYRGNENLKFKFEDLRLGLSATAIGVPRPSGGMDARMLAIEIGA